VPAICERLSAALGEMFAQIAPHVTLPLHGYEKSLVRTVH